MNAETLSQIQYLKAALREIAKREGAFSRDHLEHCTNAVESMGAIAEEALAGTWERPS